MEAGWFIEEVCAQTQHCDFPPLVTTPTDGDNGGWFRNRDLLGWLQQRAYRAASAPGRRAGSAPL